MLHRGRDVESSRPVSGEPPEKLTPADPREVAIAFSVLRAPNSSRAIAAKEKDEKQGNTPRRPCGFAK
jgi:hypothetical protein